MRDLERDFQSDPAAAHTPPRFRWLALAAISAAVAAWVYAGLPGYHAFDAARPKPTVAPAPVHAATVGRRDVPVYINGLGTVQATNTVTIRSRVDGQIEKLSFVEGQIVHEGDVLVQIDPAPFRATFDQAVAKLAQDQASLLNARQDLARTTTLSKSGDATIELLDQRTATVAQMTAQIQADQAAIESAKVQLDYTTIKAPLTGRAGIRFVDAGNIVHANDQAGVVTITQLTPISVIFTAPEDQLPAIRGGLARGPLPVTAYSSDGTKRLADGQLALVDNTVDLASGTIRLKASFDNTDGTLWPGQSVTTRLLISTVPNTVAVPDSAIQRGPSGPFALVIGQDGKAELHNTKVGRVADGWAIVENGLQPGDRVITSGHYRVQPGDVVQVVDSSSAIADDTSSPSANASVSP